MPAIGNINVKLTAQTGQFASSLNGAAATVNKFSQKLSTATNSTMDRLASVAVKAASAMDKLNKKIDGVGASTGKAAGKTKSFTSSLLLASAGGAAFALAAKGVSAVYGGMKNSIGDVADFERSQVAFEVLLGSAQKAEGMLNKLQDYATKSPFSIAGVNQSAQQLLNFGVSAQDLMPTIKMLGDVAAGDQGKMERLAYAFGQMSSAGRLMGQDLGQFINAGFNPLQEIAKKTGESMLQLRQRMEAGGIASAEVRDAFKTATSEGGRFYQMTEKQSTSLGGLWNSLTENVSIAMRDVTSTLMGAFNVKGILTNMIGFTSTIKETITSIVPVLKQYANTWVASWNLISSFTSGIWGAIGGAAGITFDNIKSALIDGLIVAEFAFNNIGSIAELAWSGMQYGAVRAFGEIGHFFTAVVPSWLSWFGSNWRDVFKTSFDYATTVFINLGQNLRSIFSSFWKWMKSGFKDSFKIDWKPLTEGAINSIKTMPDVPKRAISELENKLGTEFNALADRVTSDLGDHMLKRQGELVTPVTKMKGMTEFDAIDTTGIDQNGDPGPATGSEAKRGPGGIEGVAALQRGSSDALSAIFKAMRGETVQDKILAMNATQLKEMQKQTRYAKDQASKTPVELVSGEVLL